MVLTFVSLCVCGRPTPPLFQPMLDSRVNRGMVNCVQLCICQRFFFFFFEILTYRNYFFGGGADNNVQRIHKADMYSWGDCALSQ